MPDIDLERSDGKVWHIPHHGVYHPQKRKIRVVFDCAASFKEASLNAHLLQGPDLTSTLIGVVTTFRRKPTVLMSDIGAMFHLVRVQEEVADILDLLWWPNRHFSQCMVEHRMTSICLMLHLLQAVLILLSGGAPKTTKTFSASR